jgi:hypothetical protein
MKKTYQGSCHCGAVRFEAEIDLEAGTSRCNCSICMKRRNWNILIKPEDFRLISGESALSSYSFGTKQGDHMFCSQCGCAPFSRGEVPQLGGAFIAIHLGSLDSATDEELATAPIRYGDGRNNAWLQPPAIMSHL